MSSALRGSGYVGPSQYRAQYRVHVGTLLITIDVCWSGVGGVCVWSVETSMLENITCILILLIFLQGILG